MGYVYYCILAIREPGMIEVSNLSKKFNRIFPGRIDRLNRKLHDCAFWAMKNRDMLWPDMERLLRGGADVNSRAIDGGTVLNSLSGRLGMSDVIRRLVNDAGADVNLPNSTGTTPVMMAAWSADEDTMQFLLSKGANAAAKNQKGSDAAHELIYGGDSDARDSPERQMQCLKLLVKAGVTLSHADKIYIYKRNGELSPAVPDIDYAMKLEVAAIEGRLSVLNKMLAEKKAPDAPADFESNTPLYHAAKSGDVLMVNALRDAGANPNLVSPGAGWLPLQVAVQMGNRDATVALLDMGADPQLHTDNGKTIIDYARASDDKGMEDFMMGLLAKYYEPPEPDVTLAEKIKTMPRLRLKNARPA